MTVEEKAQEFLNELWFVDGWRRFAAAKKIAISCMEASKNNDDLFHFYSDVFNELTALEKSADK